jgi:hypothetical protein
MTVDEMIEELTADYCPFYILNSRAKQIIAALRAGQRLRDWPRTPEVSWDEVSKAWDAATKGDDE